jgi:hypothetical protein
MTVSRQCVSTHNYEISSLRVEFGKQISEVLVRPHLILSKRGIGG